MSREADGTKRRRIALGQVARSKAAVICAEQDEAVAGGPLKSRSDLRRAG